MSIASAMYCISRPTSEERLNGMRSDGGAGTGLVEVSDIPLVVIQPQRPRDKAAALIKSLRRHIPPLRDDAHPRKLLPRRPRQRGLHQRAPHSTAARRLIHRDQSDPAPRAV